MVDAKLATSRPDAVKIDRSDEELKSFYLSYADVRHLLSKPLFDHYGVKGISRYAPPPPTDLIYKQPTISLRQNDEDSHWEWRYDNLYYCYTTGQPTVEVGPQECPKAAWTDVPVEIAFT